MYICAAVLMFCCSLLLLDEATSALDPETEASIVMTLERLVKSLDMMVVSVTHRIATTQNADMIYVMIQGEIVERGTYNELILQPDSLFSELAKTKQPDRKRSIRFGSRASENDSVMTSAAVERLTRDLENKSFLEERVRSRSQGGRNRSQNGSQLREGDGQRLSGNNKGFLVL
ncbi:hypothetical protein THRCLA_22918 [Thraustotheca clavata]|uniref:ATP-binding Cassette (ABC) Superfamily n=1 Tax=Thraustotheca clavata TaxID=74557 RepID=A0A1V9YNU5_9STRA|nr:hypothetical protein THRCLA_22918 [Thraustotheca clavata]